MRSQGQNQPQQRRSDSEGWIYVLSNASMPGLLKIGLTRRDPQYRARELSGSTGVPTPFVVEHSRYVSDCRAVEKVIHRQLDQYRVGKNREFFQMPLADAVRAIDEATKFERAGSKVGGGCVSSILNALKWLFLWPLLLPAAMWKQGWVGKLGATGYVVVVLFLLLLQGDVDDSSTAITPTDETGMNATSFPVVLANTTATATTIVVNLVDVMSATPSLGETAEVMTATSSATPTDMPTSTATVVAVVAAPTATAEPTSEPTVASTNTPLPSPTATTESTNTPTTIPTNTSIPTVTPQPTNTPLPAPTATPASVANRDANLRAGPGTEFAIAGTARAGDTLTVIGRNAAGDWYELEGGNWIAAFLVDGAADVPVAAAIPTVPPTVDVLPTATAVMVQAPAAPATAVPPEQGAPNPQAFQCVGGCAVAPDPSCAIKGNVNVSSGTWIYHIPGGRFYDNTDIKPEEGDRWFCTTTEAQAAGFRASQR